MLASVLIPETVTMANIMVFAPPKTGAGIIVAKTANLGTVPSKIKIAPEAITT
jgi:hypothetical protein